MTRSLALALLTLAVAPATAIADEPVMSVSVTVEIGSSAPAIAEAPAPAPACDAPELTVRLAQRPLRRRAGTPVLARGRTYRFTGRLLCAGTPAPEGTPVGAFAVGPRGRIDARVAYTGARAIEFSAHDATVRIAVRPR